MSRPITDAQIAEIHRLRDEGYSRHRVAKMTGHTSETVDNHWFDADYLEWVDGFRVRWENMRKRFKRK
ncbi:hypothetical protein LQE92_08920 [Lacrimispora sp. NSJ-141]|uniref:Homeodomain-like domain-containing protein n=1 Tax=Lientehia hominis TaxID=2897778 RepID=A0AAP2RIB5_9FIRM|nr:hypothetical protein [Lientehia hominis]MCD2492749.1 hypothetical protein [Lientehia hominis]